MSSERLWILVLALTAFCAGVAAGILLALRQAPVEERPFASYERQMIEAFDLDEERVKNLRYILRHYQEEVDTLKERNLAALDPELVEIGHEHRALVRERVVPAHYLQQFDLWSEGLPAVAPAPGVD
jgi:hypothetical protein